MDEADILTTVAQLAIGVAGFSGIAIVFSRQPGKLVDIEAYRIAILFANAFAAMFISLLPFPLYYLFGDPETVWRIGSAIMVVFIAFFLNYFVRQSRRFWHAVPEIFNPFHMVFTIGGHILNLIIQVANAAGVVAARHSAVFVFGVIWLLFHSTFQFGRILFVQPPTPRERVTETVEHV